MTVIAMNLREAAADQLVTVKDGRPYHTAKLSRLEDGSIIGYCGGGYEPMVAWLKSGALQGNEPKRGDDEDWQILRLTQSGLLLYTNCPFPDPLKERLFTIGSGANVAMYAMQALKKKPADACRAAITVVDSCGGSVDVMRLHRPKKGR